MGSTNATAYETRCHYERIRVGTSYYKLISSSSIMRALMLEIIGIAGGKSVFGLCAWRCVRSRV